MLVDSMGKEVISLTFLLLLGSEVVRPLQVYASLLVSTRRLTVLPPVGQVILVNSLIGVESALHLH
jgi:hypothetical protein